MAITQISQITVRKGLQQDLPQLAGGEFGWAVDTQQLYIGNGTLAEGAPALGVTEVVTTGSDSYLNITGFKYTGSAQRSYVPSESWTLPSYATVQRTINNKLEDIVSVKDFGATGDGFTNDTESINYALQFLYENPGSNVALEPEASGRNIATRKALYFPAGTYLVSSTISIPGFCKIYGEGLDHTIITVNNVSLSPLANVVTNITGANVQTQSIEIADITFANPEVGPRNVLELDRVGNIAFNNVRFINNNTGVGNCVVLNPKNTPLNYNRSSYNITFNQCEFSNSGNGINYGGSGSVTGLTVTNSLFQNLTKGIWLPDQGNVDNITANGVHINNNLFDTITQEAVRVEANNFNFSSAQNIFLNCANRSNTIVPTNPSSVIWSNATNFISTNDLFNRTDGQGPRITVNGKPAIFFDGSKSINAGLKTINSAIQGYTTTPITLTNFGTAVGYVVDYNMSNGADSRKGRIEVAGGSTYTDDYTETTDLVVAASVTNNVLSFTGTNVTIRYSVEAIQNNN